MARSSFLKAACLLSSFLTLTNGQNVSSIAGSASSSLQSTATIGTTGTAVNTRPIFTIPPSADRGKDVLPNVKDPKAINAQDVCPGYKATEVKEDEHGLSAILTLAGNPCNVYGNDIDVLNLKVEYQSANRIAINISPAHIDASNASHYIVPEDLLPRPKSDDTNGDLDLEFEWDNEPSFWFSVTRQSTGDVIFTTKGKKLVYEDQFIEFASALPKDYNLSGLGERIHGLRLRNDLVATIYAADVGDPIDYNIYGSHPFYLETRYFETNSQGNRSLLNNAQGAQSKRRAVNGTKGPEYESYAHGVYLRNAHGQEVKLQPDSITWRLLGGSIDLFFFDGPTPADVTKQYQLSAIGLPAMQSYWTLGFHQCRWGYRSWNETREIVDTMKAFNIPLETIWLDIDYMYKYRDFSLDPEHFSVSDAKTFFERLHQDNQHFMPIVDGAIYIPNPQNPSDAYNTYNRGNESGVFLNNPDGSQYIGAVWPGYTVFPDWLSNNAVSWWVSEMVQWFKDVPYDGFWVDMTEVSSFCVGSCGTGNVTLNPVHPPFYIPGEYGNQVFDYPEGFNLTNATEAASATSASLSQAAMTSTAADTTPTSYFTSAPTPGARNVNHPPYVINHVHGDLAVHAVSPNATHQNGVQEYDVHNLWGHQIINATYKGLLEVRPGKRPFIIGRSTFAGSGKWAGHWGGDNGSKWYYMYFSIPQALSFSLFGIPMFGVDTCGFNGNTDLELCSRWMQLSAFFPFYRNHNTIGALSQEPYRWESVASASRSAMAIRYAILPYMYTLFHQAHTTGSTVMRALAWEFPNEPQLAGVDKQFLLGPNILVTPVLDPGVNTVNGLFPGIASGQVWYDWYTNEQVSAQAGVESVIPAPLGHIPVYIRGGSVIPTQEPGYTTTESRKNPWGLIVALSEDGVATGELYIDDGESLEPSATLDITFEASEGELKADIKGSYKDTNTLGNVTILGVDSIGDEVALNGWTIDKKLVNYNETSKVLKLSGLNDVTKGGVWQGSWTLSWQ